MSRMKLLISFLIAFLLSVQSLPAELLHWRPEWVAMVLYYWVLAWPDRVGLGWAFLMGLVLDVLEGTLLGMNALALALVAYLILSMHQRIKMFPVLQQSFVVFLVIGINLMLCQWIKDLTGYRPPGMSFLLPAISSALLWPLFYLIMRRFDR